LLLAAPHRGVTNRIAIKSSNPRLARSGRIPSGQQENRVASSAGLRIAGKNAKKFLRLLQIGRVKG
jgi:hypothetical protein